MCQRKPGLRCNTHAENNFIVASMKFHDAIEAYKDDPKKQYKISQANEKFVQARRDYWCSDQGLAALQESPEFSAQYEEAIQLRQNRKQGVEKINQARAELDTSKHDDIVQKQLTAVLDDPDKDRIKAFQEMLNTSLERQTEVDKDLRQKYTDLLDNNDTSNQLLPKHIAETDYRIASIKDAQQKCEDALTRLDHEQEAARFRERAAEAERQAQESWKRSDTDGFLSQWASGITAQENRLKAQLAEQGGKEEFAALFTSDGKLIHDAHYFINNYGKGTWVHKNEDGQSVYFNESEDRNEERAKQKNRAKGYYVGKAKFPAYVTTVGSGRGLAGAASVRATILPKKVDNPEDIEVTDNGVQD